MFLNYHAWLTDMLASKDIYNDPNLFDAYKQKLIALFLWPSLIFQPYHPTWEGPGWINELGSWITYHQYGVGSHPAL